MRLGLVFAVACVLPACALLTNLNDLGATDAAAPDVGTTTDAAADVSADVTSAPDAGDAGWSFLDDFNRADAGTLGNNWVTKQPAFTLASNAAMRVNATSYDYRDLMVYRPASEDVADVQASFELHYGSAAQGWPQIHVRIQSATAGLSNTLDDYLLFPQSGGTTSMIIARNNGTANYTTLATFSLGSPLDTTHTFRFTLAAKGTSPVVLTGSVERLDGSSWTLLGTSTVQDSDASRIATPGSFGFSGGSSDTTGQYSYDNFTAHGM